MEKKWFIGIAAAGTGAALIMGGLRMQRGDRDPLGIGESEETSEEDRQKIEQLYWEELQDEEKYGFCSGTMNVNTHYSDPILKNTGTIEYSSSELLLFNKEAQKLFIVAREAEFAYSGRLQTVMGELAIDVPVEERGTSAEVYDRRTMPVRIDIAGGYIATDPDYKENNWVAAKIGEEWELGPPRTGCEGVFMLDSAPGKDVVAGNQMIAIDRACSTADISGSYDGTFSYACSVVDYRKAMELLEDYRTKEELQNTKDAEISEPEREENPEVEGASAREKLDTGTPLPATEFDERRFVPEEEESDPLSNEDIRKQLEELRQEMQADIRAE